ncbi:hypothetical protein [Pleurocapsa sp. CCALA 161]|nr:hypothetical protein [Pleurocapsa sp. CCALA 161]
MKNLIDERWSEVWAICYSQETFSPKFTLITVEVKILSNQKGHRSLK